MSISLIAAGIVIIGAYWFGFVRRNIHLWISGYLRHVWRIRSVRRTAATPVHIMFCFADHFEPLGGGVSEAVGLARVKRWLNDYPALARRHRDADGRPPAHTFFYPEEEYREEIMNVVTDICNKGYGEVEVHLHHDGDTDESLRRKLTQFVKILHERHGVLGTRDGRPSYGFIHGNWTLDNSGEGGRWCGVNNELIVLRETGCYADFTLPSAPSAAQTSTVNSIYYAKDDPEKPKSHDKGVALRVGGCPWGDLMIIQGPLALHWRYRKWGIWPRVEDSDIWMEQVPIERRVDLWVRQHICVEGKPDWVFIKIHTHGCVDRFAESLFSNEMERMFAHLESRYNDGARYALHYVTAREMYNIVVAAERGASGDPAQYRDFVIQPPHYGGRRRARS